MRYCGLMNFVQKLWDAYCICWAPLCGYRPVRSKTRSPLRSPTKLHALLNDYPCVKFIYLLTYSMEQTPSWEANWLNLQLIKKFPAFYGTRKFITVLTGARHLSLSWANPIKSPKPLPTSWRSILILSSHLRLGLPTGLFPSGFPAKPLCTTLPSSIRATCPACTYIFLIPLVMYMYLTSTAPIPPTVPEKRTILKERLQLKTVVKNTKAKRFLSQMKSRKVYSISIANVLRFLWLNTKVFVVLSVQGFILPIDGILQLHSQVHISIEEQFRL